MKKMFLIGAAVAALCVSACASNEQSFKKASPQQIAQTNMQLAIEYMKLGKMAEARDFIERALSEDGDNANVQMTSGLVYERLREVPKAEHGYATAYRIGKRDPNIVNAYAGFLCRNGKAQQGEKLFAEAANDPTYQTPEIALVNAGVCVRGTGDLVDAEKYFNKALSIQPNLPEAMLQLGNIEFDRGDAADAADIVKRYLAVNPPQPEVLWLGFRAERKLGNNTSAAAYARRVQSEFPNSEQALMMRSGVQR
jgi:type IV pilus assembly protein PilF